VEAGDKSAGGTIPYLTNLLVSLLAYKNKNVRLTFDGQTLNCRANSVIAANGRYFGGGMFIAPNAALDDGLFDLVLLGDLNKIEVVANLPRLYKGTHITHPKIKVYHASEIQVSAQEPLLVQADGELVGQAPATFRVVPGALRVKV
jgi:diacylglycerol kinase (ATP)